jgi:hypothetical protein
MSSSGPLLKLAAGAKALRGTIGSTGSLPQASEGRGKHAPSVKKTAMAKRESFFNMMGLLLIMEFLSTRVPIVKRGSKLKLASAVCLMRVSQEFTEEARRGC